MLFSGVAKSSTDIPVHPSATVSPGQMDLFDGSAANSPSTHRNESSPSAAAQWSSSTTVGEPASSDVTSVAPPTEPVKAGKRGSSRNRFTEIACPSAKRAEAVGAERAICPTSTVVATTHMTPLRSPVLRKRCSRRPSLREGRTGIRLEITDELKTVIEAIAAARNWPMWRVVEESLRRDLSAHDKERAKLLGRHRL